MVREKETTSNISLSLHLFLSLLRKYFALLLMRRMMMMLTMASLEIMEEKECDEGGERRKEITKEEI